MTNVSDKALSIMLNSDPLAIAEDITGASYKDDQGTMALGFALHMAKKDGVDRILANRDDTTFSNQLDNYERIIESEGFEKVLEIPFHSKWDYDEKYFVYWHKDGILLSFDTYMGERVNGGSFYYNIRPFDSGNGSEFWHTTSSGSWRGNYWAGHHDCREAFRLKLRRLRSVGEFMSVWESDVHPWLCHYGDHSDEPYSKDTFKRYNQICQERIAMLPDRVRKAIAVCIHED